jgi:transcriptional regulator GlxA family with amidase domain
MTPINALNSALAYIEEHYMEQVTLEDLIRVSGVSKYSLTRLFKRHLQIPPQRWIWSFRIFVAKNALSYWPDVSCQDVAFACGFETPSHFSRLFREIVGETPHSYKKRVVSQNIGEDVNNKDSSALATMASRAFMNQECAVAEDLL